MIELIDYGWRKADLVDLEAEEGWQILLALRERKRGGT